MKHTLLIITALMLIVGCSKPINDETLIEMGRLKYHPETKELYSGEVFQNRMGGEKEFEGSYKDGKKDGVWITWYENGQKSDEGTWKDGERDGLRTGWYENGQKWYEGTYKDGKLISFKMWNEDGSVEE